MSDDFAVIGRVELLEKHHDDRYDIALEFGESPNRFRLLAEADDNTGLMLVKETDDD